MDASHALAHAAPALRRLLHRKGRTQASVAEAMGVTPGRISRYCSGKVVPSLPSLLRMLDAMDADLSEFHLAIERSKGTMESTGGDPAIDLDELLNAIENLVGSNPSLLRMFLYVVYSLDIRIDFSQTGAPGTDHLAVLYETSPLAARLVTCYSEAWSRAQRRIAEDGTDV